MIKFESYSQVAISYEDLKFLYNELEKTWNEFGIVDFHREVFSKYIEMLPQHLIPGFIAQEIHSLETSSSAIVPLLEAIKAREFFIGKLKSLNEKSKNPSKRVIAIYELECAGLISKLRKVTVSVFTNLFKWKQQFKGYDCEFYWNSICYTEKVKHDLDFLREICRFNFMIRDPFFLNVSFQNASQKAKDVLKLSAETQKKINKILKFLNYGLGKLPDIQLSVAKNATANDSDKVFSVKVPTRKEMIKIEQSNIKLSIELFPLLVDWEVFKIVNGCVDREYFLKELNEVSEIMAEWLMAELVLQDCESMFFVFLKEHSEIVLEKYVEESVQLLVYEAVTWDEVLMTNLACEIINGINFGMIVKYALSEIREENESMLEPIFQQLVLDVLKQDWVTIVIDEAIEYEKAQEEEIFEEGDEEKENKISADSLKKSKLIEKMLPEEVYFSVLFEYPGKKWIQSIIKAAFKEVKGDDEPILSKLMPL